MERIPFRTSSSCPSTSILHSEFFLRAESNPGASPGGALGGVRHQSRFIKIFRSSVEFRPDHAPDSDVVGQAGVEDRDIRGASAHQIGEHERGGAHDGLEGYHSALIADEADILTE
jgi:hypothetical protein